MFCCSHTFAGSARYDGFFSSSFLLQTQFAAVGTALASLFSDTATAQCCQAGRQTAATSALPLGRGLLLVLHLLLALRGTIVLTLGWAVRLLHCQYACSACREWLARGAKDLTWAESGGGGVNSDVWNMTVKAGKEGRCGQRKL
jgi:hypothetical protein